MPAGAVLRGQQNHVTRRINPLIDWIGVEFRFHGGIGRSAIRVDVKIGTHRPCYTIRDNLLGHA
jgi:hypothetical protein